MRKIFLFVLAAMVFTSAASASAAVILATDFTGNARDNLTNTVSNISWDTVDGINTPANSLVFVGSGSTDLNFQSSSTDFVNVAYNLSFADQGPWSFTVEDVTLDAGTSQVELTTASLLMNATSGSGSPQISIRNLQLTVEVIGLASGSLGSFTESFDEPSNGTGSTYEVDLSGLTENLDSSQTYDFVFTVSSTFTSGVNASIDDLVINGNIITAIPEPSSLLLGGLGLLGFIGLARGRR
jgi:PEP-CTERM motif.